MSENATSRPTVTDEIPAWRAWSAGLLLVSGILHLNALQAHLAEAIGTGIYFFVVGAGQILWAILAVLRPARRMARIGLALLAVAPTMLWLMTRLFRSPWGLGPEPFDFVSVGTVALQVAAAAILASARTERAIAEGMTRKAAVRTVAALVILGAAVGALSYAGALGAEEVFPWLGEAQADHHVAASPETDSGPPADDGHAHEH